MFEKERELTPRLNVHQSRPQHDQIRHHTRIQKLGSVAQHVIHYHLPLGARENLCKSRSKQTPHEHLRDDTTLCEVGVNTCIVVTETCFHAGEDSHWRVREELKPLGHPVDYKTHNGFKRREIVVAKQPNERKHDRGQVSDFSEKWTPVSKAGQTRLEFTEQTPVFERKCRVEVFESRVNTAVSEHSERRRIAGNT